MAKPKAVPGIQCVQRAFQGHAELRHSLSSTRELRLRLDAMESASPARFFSLMVDVLPSLAVWFPPVVYQQVPVLLPHVQRDNACRKLRCAEPAHVKSSKGIIGEARDQWSMPSAEGYVRDDNSLIKNAPKALLIDGANDVLRGRNMGTGFVACHIWPMQTATDPWLNSFVANLVWLPKPFDLLSDRDGIVRSVLENMAYETFRAASTAATTTTEPLWSHLPRPPRLPTNAAENFFACTKSWIAARQKKIRQMSQLLHEVSTASATRTPSGHSHYDAHRGDLGAKRVRPLADRLREYAAEIGTAARQR